MNIIGPEDEVSDYSSIAGGRQSGRGFRGKRSSHAVRNGANPAYSFRNINGVPGVSSREDRLKTPKHGSRALCIGNLGGAVDLTVGDG